MQQQHVWTVREINRVDSNLKFCYHSRTVSNISMVLCSEQCVGLTLEKNLTNISEPHSLRRMDLYSQPFNKHVLSTFLRNETWQRFLFFAHFSSGTLGLFHFAAGVNPPLINVGDYFSETGWTKVPVPSASG